MNYEFDFTGFREAVQKAIEMKNDHIEEIRERFITVQDKCEKLLEEAKSDGASEEKILYLTGLVDGVNYIVEPFKKYQIR